MNSYSGRKNSLRLQGFHYGSDGAYFITVCTHKKQHFFGSVFQAKMHLNPLGKIVKDEWLRSADIRTEIILDTYCIMPNHFHAIVWIAKEQPIQSPSYTTLPQTPGYTSKPGVIFQELGNLVNGFKGSVTRHIRKSYRQDFGWQRGYHDRIIRNETELLNIRNYIHNNPRNWPTNTSNP
ncbi:MAG: transposase [Bacteroidota bacterium]